MSDALATTILIADGDASQRSILKRGLEAEGFETQVAAGREEALAALKAQRAHIAILDLGLPGCDAVAFCRELQLEQGVPVIMSIPRVTGLRRVAGLDWCVEDFIVKPVEISEVVLRVHAALKRSRLNPAVGSAGSFGAATSSRFRFETGILDIARRMLWRHDGARVELTEIEFRLLRHLVINASRPMTRDELWSAACGKPWQPYDRNLDVHIAHLRRKIEPVSGARELIQSVRGVGYVFSGSVERLPSSVKPSVRAVVSRVRDKMPWGKAEMRRDKAMAKNGLALRNPSAREEAPIEETDPLT